MDKLSPLWGGGLDVREGVRHDTLPQNAFKLTTFFFFRLVYLNAKKNNSKKKKIASAKKPHNKKPAT